MLSLIVLGVPGVATAEEPAAKLMQGADCGADTNPGAPEPEQEDAMRCLVDHVRDRAGAGGAGSQGQLERAAGGKAGDVVDCGFSHTACGNAADEWARRTGYIGDGSWRWGENLARGRGGDGTARSVVEAWLASGSHRQTLLTGAFEHIGVGLKYDGGQAVWVLQLGCHGC